MKPVLLLVTTWLACLPLPGRAAPKPNFLLILTDDHGYGDVSAYHASDVRTPNIDRLAAEGMLFTTMRANATVCSPSRAALLTGCYADRVGVPGVIRTHPEDSWGWFNPKARTLAEELKQAGYHTAIIGKWHLGLESPSTPRTTIRGAAASRTTTTAACACHSSCDGLRRSSPACAATTPA